MKTDVFVLMSKPFDLKSLVTKDYEEIRIHKLQNDPETRTQMQILMDARKLLDELPSKFHLESEIFIVLEATPRSIGALIVLLMAFTQLGCPYQIWVMKDELGTLIGYIHEMGEAQDWAQLYQKNMRNVPEIGISNLENKEE